MPEHSELIGLTIETMKILLLPLHLAEKMIAKWR
jgi:hypothetical protein